MPAKGRFQRTRIKMCGLTRKQDVEAAIFAGTDALGFVLWSGSKRAITPQQLADLTAGLPPFVSRVGLFVDADMALIEQCAPYLDAVQFHGNEAPKACVRVNIPWFKAIRMQEGVDVIERAHMYEKGAALLLDAYHPGVPGGTGATFDWQRVPVDSHLPVILAGGLHANNVGEAISRVRPYAVDVSGGIESSPGIKCATRMQAFVRAVRQADDAH